MELIFFSQPSEFRQWLEKNHNEVKELWVGYYKKASGIPSITWPESVDEALCFGWIDGLRKSIDEKSYKIRFTPRRPGSHWSAVNIKRVGELKALGLMQPAGLEAFEKRDEKKSKQAAFEQQSVKLPEAYELKIKANKKAWGFFLSLAPSYKKTSVWWVISAKQEATRLKRLDTLIASSEKGEKIPPLKWHKKK